MPRPKVDAPAYRYHISGQARVTLDGRDFFLGEYDSPESKAKYFTLLAEYNANGKTMPIATPRQLADAPVTVRCITAEFREYIEVKYANNPHHRRTLQNLCMLLEDEYGDVPAAQFGPRKLAELRDLFVASGNNRRYANQQTRSICSIFKHAISRELIDVNILLRLQTLEPLRRGQTPAPESIPRKPVELSIVAATAKKLSPVVRAMVRIQVATGMRPSEVCKMRPSDIDQTDPNTWIYRPAEHKTAHRGKTKAVPILGDARAALQPFMDRSSDAFCFSPKEAIRWHRDQKHAARKTPLSCGDRPGSKCKENPKRPPGDAYTKDSYRRAVQRAAKEAGVEAWTPYQLRYTAGTQVRDALGVEAAQALLGHSHVSMTEHYAKQSEAKAIEAARVLPGLAE
ncbi:tyrosine-type recombinase/integrase [Novipirellula artificiosorum]|uniref:Site-specific tyrosine recombinase XerC n=1 Tax=Novipirellula artificiosorum TaxID=2528016 RepID=A0A5C6CW39_9BACT|nr:site-specific integrase [Novipirellula artificiosorum]TWU27924.1 site-specific tyrosine recombinase XerC [Novipirellula artificiosorum]